MKPGNLSYSSEVLAFAAGLLIAALMFNLPLESSENFSGTGNASANIVAVSSSGEGTMKEVKVRIVPGNGEVLVETDPFIRTDTQISAKTAREVAEEFTGKNLENSNLIYEFDINGSVVGGPSAGAAMTLATIAAIEGRKLPEDVAVTGTIRPDGRIGRVGGVPEKAYTAAENGVNHFFVPQGQKKITYYERTVTEEVIYPGMIPIKDVKYRPETIELEEALKQDYSVNVSSISTIKELHFDIKRLRRRES